MTYSSFGSVIVLKQDALSLHVMDISTLMSYCLINTAIEFLTDVQDGLYDTSLVTDSIKSALIKLPNMFLVTETANMP